VKLSYEITCRHSTTSQQNPAAISVPWQREENGTALPAMGDTDGVVV
jgi:hypothetical protein